MTLSNLFVSYGKKEHDEAIKEGFKLLGVGHDDRGTEVHVFDMAPHPVEECALTSIEAASKIEMLALFCRLQSISTH